MGVIGVMANLFIVYSVLFDILIFNQDLTLV
jgi:hypothetical protein